jgi:hypothetical protein
MRKLALRIFAALLVTASLASVSPTRQAQAQSTICVCNLLCIRGDHCCVVERDGICHPICIPNSLECPVS